MIGSGGEDRGTWSGGCCRGRPGTIQTAAQRGAELVKQVLLFSRGGEGPRGVLSLKPLLADGMTQEAAARVLYAKTEGNGVTGYVAATGETYVCSDAAKDPRFLEGNRRIGAGSREVEQALVAAAKSVTIPALLVRGASSELVQEEHAKDFLKLVPHATYVDVTGARHMVAGDRNDQFAHAIETFLRTIA